VGNLIFALFLSRLLLHDYNQITPNIGYKSEKKNILKSKFCFERKIFKGNYCFKRANYKRLHLYFQTWGQVRTFAIILIKKGPGILKIPGPFAFLG
jgi:hypothetical protein